MNFKKIISMALTLSMVSVSAVSVVRADESELFYEKFDMTKVKADKTDGVVKEIEVPDGDYTVTVKTGGKKETNANVYINGGERVRVYTLEAGQTQDNEQPVVPKDGKITVQVLGENPNVTEIEVKQLPDREEKGEKTTIYIAGDSTAQTYNYATAYPQTGWGQMFGNYFTDDVVIENRSMAGRSSKSYNNDGRLDRILTEMHPGDYVFIQFGINDGDVNKAERYISVEDYTTLITEKYMGEVEKRGGIPVLMTASAAGWWDEENNCFMESRQDYADPTREIAKETGCAFIDINRTVTDMWNSMDKDEVISGYFVCEPLESKAYPVGTNDTTHMKPKNATLVAKMVAEAIPESVPELAKYLKGDEVFNDISGHWAENVIKSLAAEGIVNGVGGGKFNPDGTVTRAEFLKMAMDACEIPGHAYRWLEKSGLPSASDAWITDVTPEDWYCYYLQGALDKGLIPDAMLEGLKEAKLGEVVITEATEDKEAVTAEAWQYEPEDLVKGIQFNGKAPITREEMAAVAVNCMSYVAKNSDVELSPVNQDEGDYFSDRDDIRDDYLNAVEVAYSYGVINGMGDGTFAPDATLTRAQASVIVNKLAAIK
ncbi:MAG: S-layer homology domain-containing protein [Oscillospiraceae bacterium]|nr:S-layer homology domain-containing protein [Oscillospiraceae bacterium]